MRAAGPVLFVALVSAPARADQPCLTIALQEQQACALEASHIVNVSDRSKRTVECNRGFATDGESCRRGDVAAVQARIAEAKRIADAKREAQAILDRMKQRTKPDYYESLTDEQLGGEEQAAVADYGRIRKILASLGRPGKGSDDEEASKVGDEVHAGVLREQACRVDAQCLAAREAKKAEAAFFASTVSPMCMADQMRDSAIETMRRERSNPSGYVNKVVLHDAGADQQAAEDQLRALAPAYVKVRKHPWPGWRKECAPASP